MATVILKATEKCNSNCYYCDVVRKADTGKSMPLEVLEQTFRRSHEYLETRPGETLEILWHGGEPLLLGPEYFESALAFQERHCNGTRSRIRHSIQTNLTLFSPEFVDVFRRLGITALGTSYDPEPSMRGPGTEIESDLYNELWMRGLGVLEEHGFDWGLIYVVTRRSLAKPLDVFFFLSNLQITGGFNMNPVLIYDEARRDVAISPDEYVEFLGTIFRHWWPRRHRYPSVEPFRSLVQTVIDGHTSLGCVDSGSCAYHHVNIAPDGQASQCGRSADWGLLPYGSIWDRTLEEILGDAQRAQLMERQDRLLAEECRDCRFWGLCHGGCPLDAWSQHKDFMHKTEWCDARRGFIERHFEPVTGRHYVPRVQAKAAASPP